MHIDLSRSFGELRTTSVADDAAMPISSGEPLILPELLQLPRVVLLAEGGAGKTWELQAALKRLRAEGKKAFFVRLEHVVDGLEGAFDSAEDIEDFSTWIASTETGWLLLDSVDESRLRSPQDFERAMRAVSARLGKAKERAQVLVSGRPSAWRPKTDLALFAQLFPFASGRAAAPEISSGEVILVKGGAATTEQAIKVVSLLPLQNHQVEAFAIAKGIQTVQPFMEAIERSNAWSFTLRPQDLDELVEFWNSNGRLGSHREWMTASVDRRLQETQNRAEARPLTPDRAREGTEKLAGALILTRMQNIRVPDGFHSGPGLNAREVLGWDDAEITSLLQRSLFNPDVYGTVRFHHRTVLEYLAAQWFHGLLTKEVSRRRVEELFFREQYGTQVVVPSLRPLLPWLALTDERIFAKLRRVEQEIVFEGGDPRHIALDVRNEILKQVCKQLSDGTTNASVVHLGAIQRFAAPDVSETLRRLVHEYSDHEVVLTFLMGMVWQGEIKQALPEARKVAESSTAPLSARIAAFRAVSAVGEAADMTALRSKFSIEGAELSRRCMAELVELVRAPDSGTLQWLLECIPRLAEVNKNDSSGLSRKMAHFFERSDVALSASAIDRMQAFLVEPPVTDRHRYILSTRYRWLRRPTAMVLSRLLQARDEAALRPRAIAALHSLAQGDDAYDLDFHDVKKLDLPQLVQEWPAVKWAWLWHNIDRQRAVLVDGVEPVGTYWLAWASMHAVSWTEEDLDLAVVAVSERPLDRDKKVALDIAFRLYVQFGRPPESLQRMVDVVRGHAALEDHLSQLMNPPAPNEVQLRLEQENEDWERKSKRRSERNRRQRLEAVERLSSQLHTLRDPGFSDPGAVSHSQAYLLEQMRRLEEDKGSHWTLGDWRGLEAEFGEATALAFRDGMVSFWRKHSPQLISEGAQLNQIPLPDLFGLAGLTVEAAETPGLMSTLSPAEACVAFRYAMRELNGFPFWFADLCVAHPEVVTKLALAEVDFEQQMDGPEYQGQYLIADIRHAGGWLASRLAPHLVQLLARSTPKRISVTEHLVDILSVSELPNSAIAALASTQTDRCDPAHRPLWAALWTSVDPELALDAVDQLVLALGDAQLRTDFMLGFASHLLGSRSHSTRLRAMYQTPQLLKRLYLLIHDHVRADEDIDRVGKGVYSPGLRDNAQEAREAVARMLGAIQGREAYRSLLEIAEHHPQPDWRPWFKQQAVAKAQADSERPPWSEKQVNEFAKSYERSPVNHREMFDLAVVRLLDLKHDLEHGDFSVASVIILVPLETELRNWIADWCVGYAHGRFTVPQEVELPDAKRPDLRWICSRIEGAVPVELKIADRWSGPDLFERLEGQLAGDYLRDKASSRGIYLLVWRGIDRQNWELPDGSMVDFETLLKELQAHANSVANSSSQVEEIKVIGIDLTKRSGMPPAKSRKQKKAKAPAKPSRRRPPAGT